jgi:hypothetical protein
MSTAIADHALLSELGLPLRMGARLQLHHAGALGRGVP